MNAMSVSPVKPTINPGNHAVPATATNLTKSPLPSSNFAPINLIPDTKPIPTVNAVPANTENSVDLCSKPPTSNGIVSPIPETNSKENSADVPQNHNEKNKAAENLTIDAPPKPLEVISETKNAEKSKPEEPKNTAASKENSEFVKGKASTISGESAKELAKDVKPITEDKKTEPAVNDVKEIESPKTEAKTVEANSEPVPEPKTETSPEVKSTTDKAKEQKEQESEANNEKDVKTEENKTEPSSETPPAPKPTKRKAKPVEPVKDDGKEDRKSKRTRLPTQPYQSPIPELQFIAKLQTPAKPAPKPTTEKIIAFFKNEFLAVRNPEGSFYICQTFQNIHKSSSRIRIRWFTNLPNDVFTPDFCDVTEFDCILTNVQMTRVEKDRWKLPEIERTRIENILKRALDVEKGVADTPSITEEHPDGLDLSLFKDEAQLKKKKKKKSASPKAKKEKVAASGKTKKSKLTKSAKPIAATPTTSSTKKSARLSNLSQTAAKETATEKSKLVENKTKKDKKKKGKQGTGTKASPSTKQNDKTKVWEPSVKSSNSSKVILSLKKETPPAASKTPAAGSTTTKTTTKRTSSVSSRASATSTSPAPAVPQKRRKDEPKSAAANQPVTNERTGKVRNAGSAVAAKINSAAMRTTKEKERKVSNTSSQRKK